MLYKISKSDKLISGIINLPASKSLSNRALIIKALCDGQFEIANLSNSTDTQSLNELLTSEIVMKDVGDAGTTFRFLTAYLAIKEGSWVLTGSARMKERPVGPLVEALKDLGADIEYLENPGYPPLQITGKRLKGGAIRILADQSSQFVSALMLIGPALNEGLTIELEGKIVSAPYIKMTMRIMRYFGIAVRMENKQIVVPAQHYQAKNYEVEADWSTASYYYALASLSATCNLQLNGLRWDSLQGDKAITTIMESFGVRTAFNQEGIHISNSDQTVSEFSFDFSDQPDLAQTIITLCSAKRIHGSFSGLETLRIKETDRIMALKKELAKVGGHLYEKDGRWLLMPIEKIKLRGPVIFQSHNDHRMAMSLSCLSMILEEVFMENPHVVRKSNPSFWDHLSALDFTVESINSD